MQKAQFLFLDNLREKLKYVENLQLSVKILLKI